METCMSSENCLCDYEDARGLVMHCTDHYPVGGFEREIAVAVYVDGDLATPFASMKTNISIDHPVDLPNIGLATSPSNPQSQVGEMSEVSSISITATTEDLLRNIMLVLILLCILFAVYALVAAKIPQRVLQLIRIARRGYAESVGKYSIELTGFGSLEDGDVADTLIDVGEDSETTKLKTRLDKLRGFTSDGLMASVSSTVEPGQTHLQIGFDEIDLVVAANEQKVAAEIHPVSSRTRSSDPPETK